MIEALETLVKTCTVWNEQQKIQVLAWLECAKDFGENLDRCSEKLEKAKKIIKEFVDSVERYSINNEILDDAEAFLKECE